MDVERIQSNHSPPQEQNFESEKNKMPGFDNIIGKSSRMRKVFDMIDRVARGDSNVAVTGESGTGKELVARSIHGRSQRRDRPFVPVNCGAFPEHLFESELFGHEKGAFTGAYRKKHGLLEFADGGTFFLDEICELSLHLQVKLLRMLQDKQIRRVGGAELIDTDVRIICASNRSLEEAMAEGILRDDLYYRLNVISIHLPPLRDRKEDIPLLCAHFIENFAKTTAKDIRGISREALNYLENYSWPGSVRELENVIERAITLAKEDWIQTVDLPEKITGLDSDSKIVVIDKPLKDAKEEILADFEKKYLTRMLARHHGNITRAAAESGVDRRTFHRLINRYHLRKSWRDFEMR